MSDDAPVGERGSPGRGGRSPSEAPTIALRAVPVGAILLALLLGVAAARDDGAAPTAERAGTAANVVGAPPPNSADPSRRSLGIALDNPEYLEPRERDRELDALVDVGAEWVRFDVKWSAVQEGGPEEFDWSRYDPLVGGARARGLNILANLAYSPPWARPEGATDKYAPDSDESRGAFAAFVAAAVERYSDGVGHWEIWNEPNNAMFWQPQPDAASYAALLRLAYAAAKASNPEAVVIGGATAPASTAGAQIDEVEFLERAYAAGAHGFFDAWSHHPYDFNLKPGTPHPDSGWWQMYGTSPSIRSVMLANGDGDKKLWATEHGVPSSGYGTLTEADQAEWLRRAHTLWGRFSWAGGPIFNYMIRDGDSPGNADYWANLGLERSDWTGKPAGDELRDP